MKTHFFNWWSLIKVNSFLLQTVQLRITVAELLPDNKTPSLGHVIVGANTSGTEVSHWNQMMTSLRKPVAMWHYLRKWPYFLLINVVLEACADVLLCKNLFHCRNKLLLLFYMLFWKYNYVLYAYNSFKSSFKINYFVWNINSIDMQCLTQVFHPTTSERWKPTVYIWKCIVGYPTIHYH